MVASSLPLVSCAMPTWNRRSFIPSAIDCWMKQTYKNRELVILDDGEEPIEDLIPQDPRIRYIFENHRRIIGDKRNRACELSRGEIICHWDDDDWSAADRIEVQLNLLKISNKPVTGFSDLLFWDLDEQCAKKYRSPVAGYVCGTSLCYRREFWQNRQFRKHLYESEDNDFVYSMLQQIASSKDARHMVARIHGCHHTSRKHSVRERVPAEQIPCEFWENDRLRLTS